MILFLKTLLKNEVIKWYIIYGLFHYGLFSFWKNNHNISAVNRLHTFIQSKGLSWLILNFMGLWLGDWEDKTIGKNTLVRLFWLLELLILQIYLKLWWIPVFFGIRLFVGYLIWFYFGIESIQSFLWWIGMGGIGDKMLFFLNTFIMGPIFGTSIVTTYKMTKESYDLMKGLSESQDQVRTVLSNVTNVLNDLNPFYHEESYYSASKKYLLMDSVESDKISYWKLGIIFSVVGIVLYLYFFGFHLPFGGGSGSTSGTTINDKGYFWNIRARDLKGKGPELDTTAYSDMVTLKSKLFNLFPNKLSTALFGSKDLHEAANDLAINNLNNAVNESVTVTPKGNSLDLNLRGPNYPY